MFGVRAGRLGKHASLVVPSGNQPPIRLSKDLLHSAGAMDLEDRALRQFDKLVESGELFWAENEVRVVEAEPFNVRSVVILIHNETRAG